MKTPSTNTTKSSPITISITLPKKDRERLTTLALTYGLSLEELGRHILEVVAGDIPEEAVGEYEDSKQLEASLKRALRDFQAGRVHTSL